jgi:hypothetical protein
MGGNGAEAAEAVENYCSDFCFYLGTTYEGTANYVYNGDKSDLWLRAKVEGAEPRVMRALRDHQHESKEGKAASIKTASRLREIRGDRSKEGETNPRCWKKLRHGRDQNEL